MAARTHPSRKDADPMKKTTASLTFALSAALAMAGGCKKEDAPTPAANPAAPAAKPGAAGGKDSHANQVAIGELEKNGLKFKAVQDEPVKAGGEAAFDLLVTGYPAGGKPKAVRFWVGVESGDGSLKAKASEESPDSWHTHAEVPNPMPAGSKFWAEVEPATGEKFSVSFDFKTQ
jgi:hypothetical protein